MSAFPHFPARPRIPLDGMWDFCFTEGGRDPDLLQPHAVTFNRHMAVPGCFDTCPSWAGKRGTAVYRRSFHVPPGRRARLRVGGLGLWARFFVDGKVVGECGEPYGPFHVDLPVRSHSLRELVVVMDNRPDPRRSPLVEANNDFYLYGGFYREVDIHLLPETRIERVYVRVLDVAAGLLQCELRLGGEIPERLPLRIGFDGQTAEPYPDGDVVDGRILLMLSVPNPRAWTPDHPHLHTLLVETEDDAIVERFGLRSIECRAGALWLNGEPMPKLKGVNRHDAHPDYGPALPLLQYVQDVQLLKDLGCNFVRGSHYPQDQRFLDLCDEMGVLVFEESLGWHVTEERIADPAFRTQVLRQTQSMVLASANHPCVLCWGFLHGGDTRVPGARELWRSVIAAIREIDLSRPITYSSRFPREDPLLGLCDLICLSLYPGWIPAGPQAANPLEDVERELTSILAFLRQEGFHAKPVLLGEIGAGALYGWRDRFATPWSEEFQSEYMARVCRFVLQEDRLAGVALWQFADSRTCMAGVVADRPRGYNNKGLLNEYRQPKLAYFTVRDFFRA